MKTSQFQSRSFSLAVFVLCTAALLVGCASSLTNQVGDTPAAAGVVRVVYLQAYEQKMLPEVTIIRRLDKQQRVSFSLTQAALILAMGQIPAHNGKEGLASHVIDGVTDRHNLQNPVSTTFVSHLESKVNAAIQHDQTLLDKFYTTPLTVVGGSARLVYENLSSDDQERFHLKLILIVSKPREHAGFTTVKKVDCTSESPEPLLQSRWAKDDYKLVKTQLDGMLNACEAKVLAGLPTLLKK